MGGEEGEGVEGDIVEGVGVAGEDEDLVMEVEVVVGSQPDFKELTESVRLWRSNYCAFLCWHA